VLVGDADAATPPELSKEMADAIPGATMVVIKNCGHLSTLEQPDAVNAAMADWLKA
jgi:pimeloyl-ACP methyl ester carboxylesterase